MTQYKTFYYEIPVMPGDYAIGKGTDGKNDNAYIMYLDIGADSKEDDKSSEALEYIDFVCKDSNGNIQRMYDGYETSKVGFSIGDIKELEDNNDKSVIFTFRRIGDTIYYSASNPNLIGVINLKGFIVIDESEKAKRKQSSL